MKNFREMITKSEFIKATNGLIEFSKKREQELAQLRAELAAVLDVCIERGGSLGYSDEDYEKRLDELTKE